MVGKQISTDTKAWYLHYTRDPGYALDALYADEPVSTYQWDSRVPHYHELAVGDFIALWDADLDILLGVSVISWIGTGESTKKILRCPKCSKAKINLRKKLFPPYRCATRGCKNEFQTAEIETVEVKTYRTDHSAGWIDLSSRGIDATFKKDVCVHPKSQQSLRPLKADAFQDFLKRLDGKIWDKLRDRRNELASVGQSIESMSGIVYVLTNPALEGYVKVGTTNNLQQRMRDLDNTSIPLPFECAFAIEVDDPGLVESLIHDAFDDRRTRSRREFFEINPVRIVSALKLTKGTDVTPADDIVEDEESRKALERTNKIRAAFNFKMVGIKPGTILEFIHDPSKTCEVLDDRTVVFEGEQTSLSASAKVILRRTGLKATEVRGPMYWCLEGETMSELRQRLEVGDWSP